MRPLTDLDATEQLRTRSRLGMYAIAAGGRSHTERIKSNTADMQAKLVEALCNISVFCAVMGFSFTKAVDDGLDLALNFVSANNPSAPPQEPDNAPDDHPNPPDPQGMPPDAPRRDDGA